MIAWEAFNGAGLLLAIAALLMVAWSWVCREVARQGERDQASGSVVDEWPVAPSQAQCWFGTVVVGEPTVGVPVSEVDDGPGPSRGPGLAIWLDDRRGPGRLS